MIPETIRIKNFLSYGPNTQEINFSQHQFICLSGKNGHGKSALLDAITWALWGQARKMNGIAKADEHLVHLGQDHMIVSFDFSCNKSIYRVTREYTKLRGKKTLSELQFGLLDTEEQTFISKTGKTSRETQEIINKTLGLSFEGCINSIFLRQGQSHEFSKKSPQERKEVLSSILGLSHLEEYRTKTLAIIRDLNKDQTICNEEISTLQEKVHELTKLEKKLEETIKIQDSTINKAKTARNNLKIAQENQQSYLIDQNLYQMALQEEKFLQNTYEEKHTNLLRYIAEWKNIRKQLHKISSSTPPTLDKKDLTQQLEKTTNLKKELFHLQKEELELRQTLHAQNQEHSKKLLKNIAEFEQKEQEYSAQLKVIEKQISSINQQKKSLSSAIEINKQKQNCLNVITETTLQKEEETARMKLNHAENSFKESHKEIDRLKEEINTLYQMQEFLKRSDAQCPTCEQSLASDHKIAVQLKYKKKYKTLQKLQERQTQREKAAKTIVQKYQSILKNFGAIRTEIQTKQKLQYEEQQLTKQYALFNEDLHKLCKEKENSSSLISANQIQKKETIAQLEKAFREKTEYVALQVKHKNTLALISKLTAELEKYDETTLQNKLILVEQWESNQATIQTKKNEKSHIKKLVVETIHQIRQTLKRLKESQERTQKAKNKCMRDNQTTTITLLQKEIDETVETQTQLSNQIAVLKNQIRYLEETRSTLQKQYAKKQALAITLEEYQILNMALGKNGIQALIIEHTLPDLEQEANTILSRLSENNTQVIFESVKDLKNGNSRETLDIHISDNMGIRPYELFSGGEAFRIDFAIRIALAKLLAKRSGTPLQTLIIDEGFGSQDEAGLEKILEALHKIQNDFEKIIIVSHLAQMKNQFPANFIIEKTATGSQITIAEQW